MEKFTIFLVLSSICCYMVDPSNGGLLGGTPLPTAVTNLVSTVGSLLYNKPPPEASMSTPQLIVNAGFPVEEHQVVTKDGYILTLFRIPHGPNNADSSPRKPLILQHGLLCSSNDWLLLPTEDNFPYILASNGYDVWLGNVRGNNYSTGHVSLTQDDVEFWDFSFDEMGAYDVPSVIDYILSKTGKPDLVYVGHSMGTVMFFIAMDLHPELQSKVTKMVALAPAVYVEKAKTPLRLLATAPNPVLQIFLDLISGGRVLPEQVNEWLKEYGPMVCSGDIPSYLCNNIIFLIAGYDFEQTSNDTAMMITGHTPSSTSARTLEHYFQYMRQPIFNMYDWGEVINFKKYGQPVPPMYNLTNVRVPVKILYGHNDWLVVPEDAKRVIIELGNVVHSSAVNYKDWNHLDFTYANDVKALLYDQCLDFLNGI